MTTLTREVIVNGTAYYPRLYIDSTGTYRGRGLPDNAVYDDTARDALNSYCKGFADAVNDLVAVDGNEWYQAGVGERYGNDDH